MEERYMTAREYATEYSRNTERQYLTRVGKAAAALCKDLGLDTGEKLGGAMGSRPKQYRVNTYPVSVLRKVFEAVRP